jgi:hypothetical protein
MSLTYGQKACGVSFNPSGDPVVADIKERFAAIIDQLNDLRIVATHLSKLACIVLRSQRPKHLRCGQSRL